MVHLLGFSQTNSFPHECMHLLWENIVPTLVDLWTGHFKGLDAGTESYEIPPEIWVLIGEEVAAAAATISAQFCRMLPNITTERHLFTAEAWLFWIQHIAPHLLKGRLASKYYNLLLFVDIIKLCLQFVITKNQINALENMVVRVE